MRSTCLVLAFGCSLGAQVPDPITEAFFKGDPTQVMLACAERAVSLKPRKEPVLAQVGRAHLIAGNKSKAEAYFQKASTGEAEAQRWIGQAQLECGDAKTGVATLLDVTGQNLRAKNAKKDAAVLLMAFGFPKEADATMSGAYAMGPRDWQNVTAFGRACLRQKRQDLAAVWFERIMKTQRKEEGLWNEIALAFADQGAER
jgi:tetratricopeptide (TPR) repeat protein